MKKERVVYVAKATASDGRTSYRVCGITANKNPEGEYSDFVENRIALFFNNDFNNIGFLLLNDNNTESDFTIEILNFNLAENESIITTLFGTKTGAALLDEEVCKELSGHKAFHKTISKQDFLTVEQAYERNREMKHYIQHRDMEDTGILVGIKGAHVFAVKLKHIPSENADHRFLLPDDILRRDYNTKEEAEHLLHKNETRLRQFDNKADFFKYGPEEACTPYAMLFDPETATWMDQNDYRIERRQEINNKLVNFLEKIGFDFSKHDDKTYLQVDQDGYIINDPFEEDEYEE